MDDLLGGGDAPAPTPPAAGAGGDMDAFASMAPASAAPVAAAADYAPPSENKAVKEWESEMEQRLEAKSRVELEEKKTKRDAATKELNEFFVGYKADIAKAKTKNRADEKDWIKLRDDALKTGANPWERVVTLIGQEDTVVKKNGEDGPQPQDTTRFKQLLVNLKGNPMKN